MLAQAAHVLTLAPTDADFQLDVFSDGHVRDMLAIDIRFDKMTAAQVLRFFAEVGGAAIARQLAEWGVADARMPAMVARSFTRGLKVPDYGASSFPLLRRQAVGLIRQTQGGQGCSSARLFQN